MFDGAMGTQLLKAAPPAGEPLEALNVTAPGIVLDIHRAYRQAGADILTANTFGANRFRLRGGRWERRAGELNRAAVELALEAAGGECLTAGSMGPLGVPGVSNKDARAAFREQAEALAAAGADLLVLETFTALTEVRQALAGLREAAGASLPVAAHVSVDAEGRLRDGAWPEAFTRLLEDSGADIIGVNCSHGPALMLPVIKKVASAAQRPVSAQPSAGVPSQGSPSYTFGPRTFAELAGRLAGAGARLIGGCCGTTPEHIARMAQLKGGGPASAGGKRPAGAHPVT